MMARWFDCLPKYSVGGFHCSCVPTVSPELPSGGFSPGDIPVFTVLTDQMAPAPIRQGHYPSGSSGMQQYHLPARRSGLYSIALSP